MNLPPMIFYGIGDLDNPQIIFTIIDPKLFIPLKEEVYTLIYGGGDSTLTRGSLHRIKREKSKIFSDLASKMQGTVGISRLWITSNSITMQGKPEYFKLIGEKMKSVLAEIFGNISFSEVPINEMETARIVMA